MILLIENITKRLDRINSCREDLKIIDKFDKKEIQKNEIICVHKSIDDFNEDFLKELNKKIIVFSGSISNYRFKGENLKYLEVNVDVFYNNFCVFLEKKKIFSLIYGKNYMLNSLLEFYDRICFFEKNYEEYRFSKFKRETNYNDIRNAFNLDDIPHSLKIQEKDLIFYKKYIYNLIEKITNENIADNF